MTKQQKIEELERIMKIEQDVIYDLQKENRHLKDRVTVISGENESLRQDKKWLQQMHSAVLQSMHSFVSGRKSI